MWDLKLTVMLPLFPEDEYMYMQNPGYICPDKFKVPRTVLWHQG